jgi:hypothetical protein
MEEALNGSKSKFAGMLNRRSVSAENAQLAIGQHPAIKTNKNVPNETIGGHSPRRISGESWRGTRFSYPNFGGHAVEFWFNQPTSGWNCGWIVTDVLRR